MKNIKSGFTRALLAASLALTPPALVNAEDIDLFVNAAAADATNPNVLIILDNSANWNSNAQHWDSSLKQGESELRALKVILDDFLVELSANGDKPRVNLGLMMFRSAAPDGGILRFAIRPMDIANVKAFIELIGEATGCGGNNSLNGTPNCILQNFSGTGVEQTNTASTDYSAGMFDAYKYFGGYTSPPYAQKDQQPPGALNDATHHGQARYFNNSTSALNIRQDPEAYDSANPLLYKSPIESPCAKNYIIFIGNGFPSIDPAGPLIANVNGGATPVLPTQLAAPGFNTFVSAVATNLGPYAPCSTAAACASAAQTTFGTLFTGVSTPPLTPAAAYVCTGGSNVSNVVGTTTRNVCELQATCQLGAPVGHTYTCSGGLSDNANLGTLSACSTAAQCQAAAALQFPGYDSYACGAGQTGGGCNNALGSFRNRQMSGSVTCIAPLKKYQVRTETDNSIAACTGTSFVNQTITGNKEVTTVIPTTTFAVPAKTNYADEWARFLYTTDVTSRPGQQNVTTYTIDVFKDQQDVNETQLLFNMAKYGGGRYFQATNENAILDALRQILIEIQSVNTVFASASLPINATNRSQNENQVFIGMFRPDSGGNPRWYGNLKRYQIAQFGSDFRLADASNPPQEAVTTATGFIQPCAVSFWTQDSGPNYWFFQNGSAGACTSAGNNFTFSDFPDGPQVEKGAVAEVLRRGNNPPTVPGELVPQPGVNRTMLTCATTTSCCPSCSTGQATTLIAFNRTNVSKGQLGNAGMSDIEHDTLVGFTQGEDRFDNNNNANAFDVRPSVHGDVAHSRPLPVNYGPPNGVVLYYGANDGTFRAVRGEDGKELWSFIAPEHHAKLQRLSDNKPPILYASQVSPPADATGKDYFFDGSAGLFQNADNSRVWIYPSMRRGGRMVYGFDVVDPTNPRLMWKAGCDDNSTCTPGFEAMGQTWSIPSVALVKGYSSSPDRPVIIMGGGYDVCEDKDVLPLDGDCTGRLGDRVYVIDAESGSLVAEFKTNGSVAADVTLVDRDFDGFADHAYAVDTTGILYRIDFVKPDSPADTLAPGDWTITQVAQTFKTNRKFLFAPAALLSSNKIYLSIASGDRERPLIVNYPFPTALNPGVLNRGYVFIDSFDSSAVDLDDPSIMEDVTAGAPCPTADNVPEANGKKGWFMDLNAQGPGEQAVTSSLIFGGLVFFSTNRPVETPPDACTNTLGEARGYVLNLLNGSGAADTLGSCGGSRSAVFVGGGLPPSPVVGTVPVGQGGKPVTVMIGGVQRGGGASTPLEAQKPPLNITQRRNRLFWYLDGDK